MTDADFPLSRAGRARSFAVYGGMAMLAVALFFVIREVGEGLPAAPGNAPPPVRAAQQTVNTLFHFLLALAAVVIVARFVGYLFNLIGQPAVTGEIVGGILLGPSLLGRLAPEFQAALFPAEVAPFLGIHAQLGVILYMFLVGLQLDLHVIRRHGQATVAISHASITVPFIFGSALALWLYPTLSTSDVPFTVFALFLGVSLSITALPVLARILTDLNISRSPMGAVALTCAAVDNVTAWCLLALVVSIAQARETAAIRTIVLTIALIVIVFTAVAPLARRVIPRLERSADLTRTHLSVMFVAMLASAMTTEYIGIHAFFGAFLLGATIPQGSRIAAELHRSLDDVVAVLFLPAFFALTGLRTEIGLVSGLDNWLLCGVIILVATAGKFGGAFAAARWAGLPWRDSAALGLLMNTRGLVELIVLNIGLDLRLISPTLFTMLVLMALITTFMTTPVLQVLLRKHPWVERAAEAEASA